MHANDAPGFEITFSEELTALAASAPGGNDRPDTAATWESSNARPIGSSPSPALVTAVKSPSPINQMSPKHSKHEKKRFSFLKRGSVQEVQTLNSINAAGTPKLNGRPSVDNAAAQAPAAAASPHIPHTNGNVPDRAGAMSPANQSEDKLQKYFGIPEAQQYNASSKISSPELEQRGFAAPAHNDTASKSEHNASTRTRQSSLSTQDSSGAGANVGSKVGSVKKRLSMLGIGKKASKASVRSRGGGMAEGVIEE